MPTPSKLILPNQDRRQFIKQSAAVVAASTAARGRGQHGANSQPTGVSSSKCFLIRLSKSRKKRFVTTGTTWTPSVACRTRVANNWMINDKEVNSDFYTGEQKDLIRKIFEGIIQPEWHAQFDKQLEDDCGGFGEEQSIAIFGRPGDGKFEFVLTGRHMTLRCDGNSIDNVAFGGPIFYGHAPTGGDEEADHKGNVFWPQALQANKVYEMLDGKQRKIAEVPKTPREQSVAFQGKDGRFAGIPITDLSGDQREQMQKTLQTLVEPFRQTDREEAMQCLKTQGGLDACYLSFYTDQDIGQDKVWDNWRLEGPSFVLALPQYRAYTCGSTSPIATKSF